MIEYQYTSNIPTYLMNPKIDLLGCYDQEKKENCQ